MIGIVLDHTELDQTMKRLGALAPKLEMKIVGQASRKAMKPMLADAKRRCPDPGGTIRENLVIRQKKFKRSGNIWTGIGPLANGFWSGASYLSLDGIVGILEHGAKAHEIPAPAGGLKIGPVVIRGTVKHPGVRPEPFLRRAFDAHARGVVVVMQRELIAGVERETVKLAAGKG